MASDLEPVDLGYADPPYEETDSLSMVETYYSDDPRAAEVPLAPLLARMDREYDGWAVSMHVPSLLALKKEDIPKGARLCTWNKTFAVFQPNVTLCWAWEPVLIKPARVPTRKEPTIKDWIAAPVTIKKGVVGAKPAPFSHWMLAFMGARQVDRFDDLFPGSGAVGAAWADHFNRAHDRSRWPFTGGAKPPEKKQPGPRALAQAASAFRSVMA